MKEALALIKKAMERMEKLSGDGDGGSEMVQEIETRLSPLPNEDGSSSSLGNSDTGGEDDDIEERKQKKAVIMAAMRKG